MTTQDPGIERDVEQPWRSLSKQTFLRKPRFLPYIGSSHVPTAPLHTERMKTIHAIAPKARNGSPRVCQHSSTFFTLKARVDELSSFHFLHS